MSLTSPQVTENAAEQRAAANFRANRAALDQSQPGVISLAHAPLDSLEWIFARDGSLTCLLPGERWWGDCSLPRRAGQFMFKKMLTPGVVACFLRPAHAAHLRVTLDMLEPQQAIVALVPEPQTAWVLLHCEDFASDIAAGRLWFAVGAHWESQLAELFVANPGLPTPSQFIRPIAIDNEGADVMIGPAQKVFAEESDRRTAQIRSRVAAWKPADRVRKLCVVAPSRFRLWNDAPHTLHQSLASSSEFEISRFDSDSPRTASPAALCKLASTCDTAITANISRADLPGVFPASMPLITWVTFPRVPAFDANCPNDVLLLADQSWQRQAVAAGWPTARAKIAYWPSMQHASAGPAISLMADTRLLDVPTAITSFSSQRILWESIREELLNSPFAIAGDIDAYLKRWQTKCDVDAEHLDRSLFIERLIVPAYQQGLARLLLQNRIPIALHGLGWPDLSEFAPYASGPIATRERFEQVVQSSAALIHAWPINYTHPIHATGIPTIRASSGADLFRQLHAPRRQPPRDPRDTLSTNLLRSVV
jgi:hypothetical protein